MNLSRNKIWFLPLLIVVLYPVWGQPVKDFLAVNIEEIDIVRQLGDSENQQFRMEDFTLYQTGNGKMDMKLAADKVLSGDPGTSEYRLKGVRCTLYGKDDQKTNITGGEALYSAKQHLVTIVDEVLVDANNGEYTVETDALRYFTKYKVAKTATPIVFKNNQTIIHGNSLMYNMESGAFRVSGDVVCDL
ncbi:MAG: LPS export ABC transporter periplasmic protein LptC [Desulfobulbaceae bacterium]|jgi:LPS export ABC transporter protein LptC|nr:LPS export ABC transporter periplasmic protein LptC [Desulfobulbaceae bacterium]